jgi:hypothetical protein
MAKKCIKHTISDEVKRVNEFEASTLVHKGTWQYIPKKIWKKEVRDAIKTEEV